MTWCQAFTLLLPPQMHSLNQNSHASPWKGWAVSEERTAVSKPELPAAPWRKGAASARGESPPGLSPTPHPGASVGCVSQAKGAWPGQGAVWVPLGLVPTSSRRSDAQRRPHEHPTVPRGAAALQGRGDLTFPPPSFHITTCFSLLLLLRALVSRGRHPGSVTTHVVCSRVKLQRAATP